MAPRKPPPPPSPGPPTIPPSKGIELLQARLEAGRARLAEPGLSPEALAKWQAPTRECLVMAFGENTPSVRDVMNAGPGSSRVFQAGDPAGEQYRLAQRYETLRRQLSALEGAIETLQLRASVAAPIADRAPPDNTALGIALAIFISHSSRNQALVETLITLLEVALRLPHGSIRCTSANGYKLEGGDHVSSSLQQDVMTCKVLLAVLTPEALGSQYVTLEIGGRMFAKLPFIPTRACGVRARDVQAPLSEYHSLDLSSPAEVHQLIDQLGKKLGTTPASPAAYQRHLEALVLCSTAARDAARRESQEAASSTVPSVALSADLTSLLIWFARQEDQGRTKHGVDAVVRGTGWKRSVAQHRLDELYELGFVTTSYSESGYGLTTNGRREAVALVQAASPVSAWTP